MIVGDNIDILMIDDNDLLLEYLTDLFDKYGYHTHCLNDSTVAVDTMVQLNPKLIILDLMMPQLDGFTILKRMREKKSLAATPVIVYTGKHYPIDEKKAKNLGANSYLVKPIKGSALIDEVKKYINEE
jgi:DNA-binding response OmpR family regulator